MIIELTRQELARMSLGHCPDCGHAGFQLGPRGGAAINIRCCACGQLYSVTNMGWQIVMGHRLEHE